MTNLKACNEERNSGELCLSCFDNLTFQYHGMTEIYNKEINRYVGWVKETDSFKLMNDAEQTTTILEKAMEFAEENEIKISERELKLMVERAVQSLQRLESIGLKLMQKRLSNNKGEE